MIKKDELRLTSDINNLKSSYHKSWQQSNGIITNSNLRNEI
jgi:hypothetical protein